MIGRAYYRKALEEMSDVQVHHVGEALKKESYVSTISRSIVDKGLPITISSDRGDPDRDFYLGIDSLEALGVLCEEVVMRRDNPRQDTSLRYRLSKFLGGHV